MAVLEAHPQRQTIIEALLAGESSRSISRRITPPASFFSIAKLAKSVKSDLVTARVMEEARKLVSTGTIGVIQNMPTVNAERLTAIAASAQPHLERIQKRQQQLDKLIDSEEDGKTAATLIRTDLASIELAGRFDRSLESTAATVVNVQNVMVLPATQAPDIR